MEETERWVQLCQHPILADKIKDLHYVHTKADKTENAVHVWKQHASTLVFSGHFWDVLFLHQHTKPIEKQIKVIIFFFHLVQMCLRAKQQSDKHPPVSCSPASPEKRLFSNVASLMWTWSNSPWELWHQGKLLTCMDTGIINIHSAAMQSSGTSA